MGILSQRLVTALMILHKKRGKRKNLGKEKEAPALNWNGIV
jgi:hypothetical protein